MNPTRRAQINRNKPNSSNGKGAISSLAASKAPSGLCEAHFCTGTKLMWKPSNMLLAGKLDGPAQLNAVAAGQLIHFQKQQSERRFLVNTEASYSIFLHHSCSTPHNSRLWTSRQDNAIFRMEADRQYSW
jgi:hypothetical protein